MKTSKKAKKEAKKFIKDIKENKISKLKEPSVSDEDLVYIIKRYSEFPTISSLESKIRKEKKLPMPDFIFAMPVYDLTQGYEYIRIKDIPEEYKEEFCKWMVGQTSPLVEYPIKLTVARKILKQIILVLSFPYTLSIREKCLTYFNCHDKRYICDAVYLHDWIRWYEMKVYRKPTYFD